MNQSALGWIGGAIAVVIFLDLLFVECRRIFREGKRIVTRIVAYGDLPVFAQADHVGESVARIERSIGELEKLAARAGAALATIATRTRVEPDLARFERGEAWDAEEYVDPWGPDESRDYFIPNGSDESKGFAAD